jgi:glutamate racemase
MSLRIGIFDSGVGGLSVLKELYQDIHAEYVYLGDSLRAPYGNKTPVELLGYMKELLLFLKSKNVDMYISACNSLSTLETEHLLKELAVAPSQYIDMKRFAEQAVTTLPKNTRVLIFTTEATRASGVYQHVFSEHDVLTLSSRVLAEAIEEQNQIAIDEEVDGLLDYILENAVTHVFLGCTHYPLIQEYLDKRFLDLGITFINPAQYTPSSLVTIKEENITKSIEIYTTKKTTAWDIYSKGFDETSTVHEVSFF